MLIDTEIHNLSMCGELETLVCSMLNEIFFFIKPFPLRLRPYVQNETERFSESEVVDDFKYTDF